MSLCYCERGIDKISESEASHHRLVLLRRFHRHEGPVCERVDVWRVHPERGPGILLDRLGPVDAELLVRVDRDQDVCGVSIGKEST